MARLIASAGTKEDLEKIINAFWCSENYIIKNEKPFNIKNNKYMDNFRAYEKRGRWRFESIS